MTGAGMADTGVALRLTDVVKEYTGGVFALRGVSIDLRRGEQVPDQWCLLRQP